MISYEGLLWPPKTQRPTNQIQPPNSNVYAYKKHCIGVELIVKESLVIFCLKRRSQQKVIIGAERGGNNRLWVFRFNVYCWSLAMRDLWCSFVYNLILKFKRIPILLFT
jgi:hypothetical protein